MLKIEKKLASIWHFWQPVSWKYSRQTNISWL